MESRLPPLNALKAFESAARHLSVKLAAEELCVTPGAVSQMLKTLEADLGVKLFERVPRGIYLTDAGRDYLPSIRNAFRQIADASRRVAASVDVGTLTVSVTPFFASAWLVPRMASFQGAHPEIDLQIVTSNTVVDFSRSGVDVAVRHGLGRYPGLRSDRVVTVEMVAVASPSLVERLGRPASPGELAGWPQVHDADRKGWSLWFQANGIAEVRTLRGPSFDDSGLLLKAVLTGQGAGLLPAAMVANEIASGELVQLLETAHLEEFAYHLVCPDNRQSLPKIAAFREWILGPEAQSAAEH
ncbi:LysR family glycine cleavage system transcriptional activator [Bradyrhizobium sp. USDA 4524]|uniref:transcriptional regulator GcvA n=1 Tax=unclassified Bradyrhizobium TaxID=2631580 RepID=UPI00209F3972|nr:MULTISPECIES: transcriptional regulator GcvA [unclassified Bradyrhizobium]MCP1844072.1 LysR family glycine cleavage system transcriptional activator [Bradyrhizobium sp. USDA 4538]MCP1904638.1 LysR family glycine cleavage system transcriptional activator [Bradyrhizobium sp. USDA 4537]MCP1989706.1 LysR family glycine cleavage system transcriptional activator [Bradyrhizobium sp. USDA 4539]